MAWGLAGPAARAQQILLGKGISRTRRRCGRGIRARGVVRTPSDVEAVERPQRRARSRAERSNPMDRKARASAAGIGPRWGRGRTIQRSPRAGRNLDPGKKDGRAQTPRHRPSERDLLVRRMSSAARAPTRAVRWGKVNVSGAPVDQRITLPFVAPATTFAPRTGAGPAVVAEADAAWRATLHAARLAAPRFPWLVEPRRATEAGAAHVAMTGPSLLQRKALFCTTRTVRCDTKWTLMDSRDGKAPVAQWPDQLGAAGG